MEHYSPFLSCISAFCMRLLYFRLFDVYYNSKKSEPFPALGLTIHYFLAFFMLFVDYMKK